MFLHVLPKASIEGIDLSCCIFDLWVILTRLTGALSSMGSSDMANDKEKSILITQ